MSDEIAEEFELPCRQGHAPAVAHDQPLSHVDADVGERELRAPRRVPVVAADLCTHAGHQLSDAEWLADVVVSAEIETLNAVTFVCASRQDDDRNVRRSSAQALAHLEPAHSWQHEVEDDER